jgi:gliding motility-associated-like protein
MKKFLCFCLSFGALTSLYSQNSVMGKDNVVRNPNEINVTFLGETDPIGTKVIDAHTVYPTTKHIKLGYHPKGDWVLNENVNPNALPKNGDEALQKDYNTNTRRSTEIGNWQGITTTTSPGDPAMDVGPNHVVQMMNGSSGARVQIWDKTGGTLLGNTDFSTLVSLPNAGLGDPIVLYDERADRWLLSEFCSGCNDMFVAISTTSDPLGTYYTYSIAASSFPDYPKYSIWDNTYLITANEGTGTSTVYALNRNAMLTGGAANAQQFTIPRFGTIGFQASTPVSLMGTTTAGTPPMLMRMRDDAWTGSASDALEIWELDIDWSSPGAATLTQTSTLATTPHESELCGYTSFACIPQQGSGTTLDPLRELLMNRIMYRNFGTHESIVCAHATDVDGADLAGIRWYELRRTGGGAGTWSIYQESTYSPDSDMRWMPTIGISESGNIGLAYNVSSSSMYPSIRYTGRKECDPLNVMTETEVTLVAGTTANNSNRWGDYNAMGVDGETFWFTAMYNPNSQARTRIGAFTIDPCNPEVQFTNSTYTIDEGDANVANGCLDYYVIDVPIQIGIDPTQPADITINVTGGTATQGVDYDISNTTFTFDGTTLVGTAEIWVYNDNNTEGNETITLDYSLNANGGNAITGTLNQTVTITINDDDLIPTAMTNMVTILSEDFNSGTFGVFSTVNASGDTPWQIGDNAAASSGPYAIPTSNTTDFAWINDDDCNCDQDEADLIFPTQDLSGYTSANLSFYTYFEDNTYGGDNENADLVVSVNGGAYATVGALTASVIDGTWITQNFDVSAYTGSGFSDVVFAVRYSDATGWLYGCTVDDVLLTGTAPIDIQTAVNTGSGMQGNLGPNETVHFYDPTTSNVMLSIVNTSSFDYGCVTVDVDRDGSTPTALEFASASTADYLHSKTYTVVPANNNPTGTFDVTLYYKEAEVTAWETATGNSRNDLEIIKVLGNNRINDVTPGNYTGYTINNVAATLGTFNSDVTLTSSFTNGFSGFGAGIYNISTVTVSHTSVNVDPDCNGGANGSITITASGGTGPYTYSINGGTSFQSSNVFNGLSANTYSVIAMDAGSNQSTPSSVTLTNPTLLTSSSTATNEICGNTDGTITITASGGTGTLQYSINGGTTFQTGNTFSGLAANSYNIVVEDANSCQSTGTQTVGTTAGPTFTSTATNENCGNSDGTITITASGGTGTIQYSINGGVSFQSGNTFSGLASTSYNVVIEDANGCQSSGTQSVGSNGGPALSSINKTDASCNGATDGSITVNATGTATLQYSDDNGATFQTSNIFNGLSAGSYMIVVEDGNGCQTFAGTVNVNQPGAINISSTSVNENCGAGDGSITITASGGVGALQYSIDGGSTFQSTGLFNGLAASGYNIVVEDANGCQNTATQSVSSNGGPNVSNVSSADPTCNGGSDGSINITASGTATLQYSIDGGSTFVSTSTFSGLSDGSFNVMVEDGNGCQTSGGNITITEPALISISSTSSNENCGNSDGSISITASGGTGTLQYSIDGGSSFQSNGVFNGLTAGNYNIVVSDFSGCQNTASETVGSNGGPTINSVNSTDETCFGSNDGTITIDATLSGTIQYSIDGGATFSPSPIFNSLSAGSYDIAVTNSSGCVTTAPAEVISSPTQITYTAVVIDENCGASDGGITITANNNIGTTTYSIDGGTNSQSSGIFTGLASGVYNIMIEDNNGCMVTGSENVNSNGGPTISSINASDVTCFGLTDGNISVVASGGTGTLQYSFDGGATFQSASSISGIASGSYNIVVTDANSCSSSNTAMINSPSAITSTVSATDATCGANDGTATVSATGGTGTLSYQWDDSGNQTGSTATGLSNGLYTVSIQDINGCTSTNSVTVNSIGQATLSTTTIDVTCFGLSDGSATVTVTGGTSPYSFAWDDPAMQTNSTATGLSAGNYNVDVTDNTGCVSSTTVTIVEPSEMLVTLTIIHTSCAQNNGIAMSAVTGGTSPYTYLWDDAANQSTSTAINLSAGTYNLNVTDINSCTSNASLTINDSDSMVVNLEVIHESCPEQSDGSIATAITGGQPPYQYNWSTGDTTDILAGLPVGSYTLTVADALNCAVILVIPIENEGGECIKIPTAISPNADGSNDTWVIDGIANYPDAVVEIYNRWGGLIISSNDYQNDWDGTFNGEHVAAGVYYFVVTIDEETTYTGSLTVIR